MIAGKGPFGGSIRQREGEPRLLPGERVLDGFGSAPKAENSGILAGFPAHCGMENCSAQAV